MIAQELQFTQIFIFGAVSLIVVAFLVAVFASPSFRKLKKIKTELRIEKIDTLSDGSAFFEMTVMNLSHRDLFICGGGLFRHIVKMGGNIKYAIIEEKEYIEPSFVELNNYPIRVCIGDCAIVKFTVSHKLMEHRKMAGAFVVLAQSEEVDFDVQTIIDSGNLITIRSFNGSKYKRIFSDKNSSDFYIFGKTI